MRSSSPYCAKQAKQLADASSFLSVGTTLVGGDVLSQKVSIGGADNRVGLLNSGLNRFFGTPSGIAGHGKFAEGDASATRYDFYTNNGDDYTFQPDLFKQLHQQALAKGDGTYSVEAVKEHFKNRYAYSKSTNKQFYFNLPSSTVVMGACYFIPAFFSNGTIGAGGVANEASITSFYGAKPARAGAWNDSSLTYTHVPERIPDNWYRRGVPMTPVEVIAGVLDVYLYALPPMGGAGAGQGWVVGPALIPNNPTALTCFLYNAIYAKFPSELFNSIIALQSTLNFLSGWLSPGFKALGCQVNYPDATVVNSTAWNSYSLTYTGPAKLQAVGSRWYKKSN